MDKLKKLLTLISEGRPTRQTIDDDVDACVDILQEEFFSRSQADLYFLLYRENKPIYERTDLIIVFKHEHYNDVFDDLKDSIQRYSPFLKLDPNVNEFELSKNYSKNIAFGFRLILEITPEMKKSIKSILLQKELAKSLETNLGAIKKQSKL